MNQIKIIKKFKAYFIRLRMHKLLSFAADYLIYIGYLIKISKWAEANKHKIKHNDFYNGKVHQTNRVDLYKNVLEDYKLDSQDISYLEFGVGRGNSLRWWSENSSNPNTTFWAFDTFEGLPEKYGSYEIGTFNMDGNFPNIQDNRINFIKGLFQDTLLSTLPKIDFTKQVIIHVDGDLYTSAIFSLSMLYPYLKKGDIIIFDEFVVPLHEFRAFEDFTKSFYIKLEPIGAINNYLQVIFEITDIKNNSTITS